MFEPGMDGIATVVVRLNVVAALPASQFLNDLFIALDSVFPLFGTLSYGIFAFYLLFCVLKGCLKFGLRCFCMSIHPMRIGNTMMNSMLFNVWMLLLTAVAIVQFSSSAFSTYARLTAVDMLFGIQARATTRALSYPVFLSPWH
jgi:LMBR1 domain-containing protein 1